MTYNTPAIIGSATIPYTRGILPSVQRGSQADGEGIRIGTQVIVANPEDLNSVEAFATSGISVGTSAVEILSFGSNPLPRSRGVLLRNNGSAAVQISNRQEFTDDEGYTIGVNAVVELPIMKNCSIWAHTTTGTALVKLLIY